MYVRHVRRGSSSIIIIYMYFTSNRHIQPYPFIVHQYHSSAASQTSNFDLPVQPGGKEPAYKVLIHKHPVYVEKFCCCTHTDTYIRICTKATSPHTRRFSPDTWFEKSLKQKGNTHMMMEKLRIELRIFSMLLVLTEHPTQVHEVVGSLIIVETC